MESDIEKINKAISRHKKKIVCEDIGYSPVHVSYVLNGKRPLSKELKEKLFIYLKIS